MHLLLAMDKDVVQGEVADLSSQDYEWVCGLCDNKPHYNTIQQLFAHKLDTHQPPVAANDNVECVKVECFVEERDDDEFAISCDDVSSRVPTPPCSDNDDEDNLPLSFLVHKPIKLKLKLKRPKKNKQTYPKKSQKPVKLVKKPVKSKRVKTDLNEKFIKLVEEAIEGAEDYIVDNNYDSQVNENDSCSTNDAANEYSKSKDTVWHVCKICEESFYSRRLLAEHKHVHRDPDSGDYLCASCGKLCPKYDNYVRHIKIHMENRPKSFQCDLCSAAFYSSADLKRHNVLHLDSKPFSCEHCTESFTKPDLLMCHVAKHTGVPFEKWKCKMPDCGKVFRSASALAMHSKHHTKKSIFCAEAGCQFSCYLRSQLKQHVRTHSGEKPYQCAQCGRCFARSNDMKTHVLNIHQRFRPFKCGDCGKEFTLRSMFRQHQMTHLDLRPYLCEECGLRFSHPSTLKKHIHSLHGNASAKHRTFADVAVQVEPTDGSVVTYAVVPLGVSLQAPLCNSQAPHNANAGTNITQTYFLPVMSIQPQASASNG